jgi:hypothetical protein
MRKNMRERSNGIAAVAACLALAAALSAGVAGCGSGNGGKSTGSGGSGGGGTSGNGTISWQDDGVAHQTSFASASLVTASGLQLLQIAGGEPSGIGIAFGVSAMPTVVRGAFQCGPAAGGGYPITSFSYTADGVDPLFQSCMVSIDVLGAADGESVSGAFSAVLSKTAGGTKAITAGEFNVPLNVSP